MQFSSPDDAGPLISHERELPLNIGIRYGLHWNLAVVLLCSSSFARFICLDTLGGLVTLILAATAVFLTRHDYQHMNKQRLSMYGVANFIELMVELLAVCCSITGRRMYHMHRMTSNLNGISKTTYVRSFEVHLFIDLTQPWYYNMQSMMMVVMPVVLLYVVCLCYVTWKELRDNSFGDPELGPAETSILFNVQAHTMYGAPAARQTASVPFQGKAHKLIDADVVQNSKEIVSSDTAGNTEVDNTKAPETNTDSGLQPPK